MKKWTADFTVEFVPLPKEMEEAYWEAIRYIADMMRKHMQEELDEKAAAQVDE
jgi:hypothetical protein